MKREETIDYHIRSAWHAISRMYNQRAQNYNATMSMGFALIVIDADEGTPATKIGPMMGLEPRSLTRLLKSLEDKKLIKRVTDKLDKRSVRICLTAEGKKQRDNARDAVVRFNEVVLDEVGAQKLSVCLEVLERVNALASKGDVYESVMG